MPKIVTERLKAARVTIDHPDADILTAFSERALPERERSRVLEHLARCSECREVVALAFPAEEPLAPVVRPARGKWLTWPRLRWGLAAAGVIVVGSFGVLRYQQRTRPETTAKDASRMDQVTKEAKNEPAPLPASSEETRAENEMVSPPAESLAGKAKPDASPENGREFDRLEALAKPQAPPRDETAGIGGGAFHGQALAHGPKPPTQQWQQNNRLNANANNQAYTFQSQTPAPAVPAAQPVNGLVVTARSPAPSAAGSPIGGPVSADKKVQTLDVAVAGRSVAPLSSAGANVGSEVARAKDAEPETANAPKAALADGYSVSGAEGGNFSASGALVAESVRWSINSVGGLQRSVDQGKTWQNVDVNSGVAAEGMTLPLAMKSSRAKVLAKEKADANPKPIVFRAVAAIGPDVWAGGLEGNLYHSIDAGAHWVRVMPSWRGIELTGDIMNLHFFDPQRGRIVTSTAEIWITGDGGQTWDKQ